MLYIDSNPAKNNQYMIRAILHRCYPSLFEGNIITDGKYFGTKISLRFLDDYSKYEIRYSDNHRQLEVKDAWITINSSDPDSIQCSILLDREKLDLLSSEQSLPSIRKADIDLLRKHLMVLGESACEDLLSLVVSEQAEHRQQIVAHRYWYGRSEGDNDVIDYDLLQSTLRKILGPHLAANILRGIENDIIR